jgi:hypothetical protein
MSSAPRGSILFRYIPGVGRVALPCCPTPTPTLPSNYSTQNGSTPLTNTFATVGTSSITLTTASHVMVFISSEINNTDTSNEHTVSMYVTTNGDTSNTTDNSIVRAKNPSTPSQASLSIVHRTSVLQPGTYTITVYGKADANSVMNITHLDIGSIGHLSST